MLDRKPQSQKPSQSPMKERNVKSVFRRPLMKMLQFMSIVVVVYVLTYRHPMGPLASLNEVDLKSAEPNRSHSIRSPHNQEFKEDQPRILIYVTTHMSTDHEELLQRCWPYVLSNSKLVQMADVKVFLNGELERQMADAELVRNVFREKIRRNKFSLHQVENPGYQEGAIAAMAMAHKNGWFEGYDWVVRVNADVIIRNDDMLLETIFRSAEENVTGIFVDCSSGCNEVSHCNNMEHDSASSSIGYLIHSDFTAFKPSALSPDLQWNEASGAEYMNNVAFQSVIAQGQDRWLVDSFPDSPYTCRLSTNDKAPVTHFGEDTDGTTQRCVDWFRDRNLSINSNF